MESKVKLKKVNGKMVVSKATGATKEPKNKKSKFGALKGKPKAYSKK